LHFAQHTTGAGVDILDHRFSAFPFIGRGYHFQSVDGAYFHADDAPFAPEAVDGDVDAGLCRMPGFLIVFHFLSLK